ncbi:MAG TPA: HAMP domain-containing sensor histidine kinase, partial [Kiritimatiellia bacterium]|nr:HAMP domain-containing sensor histidine kinase [Kiritimatiellia bacterium]
VVLSRMSLAKNRMISCERYLESAADDYDELVARAWRRYDERLLRAQEERTRHMLATTHQLKAPFAAIQANTQLMLDGYCGELPAEARDVAQRISARCRRLTRDIQDMLQLANLRSEGQKPPAPQEVDLQEAWRYVIHQLEPLASEREVRLDIALVPARVPGIPDHLKMLFINLLSNAIMYSRRGGRVRVEAGTLAGGGARVRVADEGIGIAPEKLPRIFDEYYRTEEAVQFNKESSGLGLAIVRHVAREHGLRLKVASRPDHGTAFTLDFPSVAQSPKRN